MRALVQRVSEASVTIEGCCHDAIGPGLLVLLGVGTTDTPADAQRLWGKVRDLRIFEDGDGKTNLSLLDVGGACMVISQFTLYANCKRGRRPSFTGAMAPGAARDLYESFLELVRDDLGSVAHGEFGAMMQVGLVNDGPFTIWLDTDEL